MSITPDELEKRLAALGREIRQSPLPAGLIENTLSALKDRPAGSRLSAGLTPVWLTGLFLLGSLPFFSISPEPLLNFTKSVLMFFSLCVASLFILEPERMAVLDHRMLGGRLNKFGPAATPAQELILFRMQGIYFVGIAFFICRF